MVPGIGLRRVQIAYVPSFDPGFSWDIRECQKEFVLYRSQVTSASYRSELKGYHQLDVPSETLKSYFTKLRSLNLSIDVYGGSSGLDGTVFHLALFDLLTSVRFTRWVDPPPQWKSMADAVKEMIEKFQAGREVAFE